MRLTRILPIFLLLTACAPTTPVPTASPLPPTVTVTVLPSSTSTPTPTAKPTQTPTLEPSPSATNTEEPTLTPTSSPTELPTQQLVEILMNREGVTGKLYEAKLYSYEELQKGVLYNAVFDGVDLSPNFHPVLIQVPKGYKLLFLNYTTNTLDMKSYSRGNKIQVLADKAGIELPQVMAYRSDANDLGGFIGYAIPVREDLIIKGVNVINKATGIKTSIYDASENPPVESK